MAGGLSGYRAALVRRPLTPGLISSSPVTAGLPPFICFSTSYPELAADRHPHALPRPRCIRTKPEKIASAALDTDRTWLYYSDMYDPIAIALVHAAHRVEARLEEALAGVGLSIAKFEALSVLVSQDRPISLSELAEKLTCVRSNVTQLVDRLEADGLVKRADDPADRRAVRAEVTALGRKRHAAGAKVVHAVLQEVAKELSAVDPLVLKRALDAVQ